MFWGLTIEPGKHYTQTVDESFHVSMVALDTRDVAASEREQAKMTQLMVQHDKAEFLICTLCFGTVYQQQLDLNFTEGEEVTFFTEGRGTLHLTGYLVKDEPLTLDPDMMSLNELSSLDGMASDSEGWASGEESSLDNQFKGQRPRQGSLPTRQKKKHATSAARQRSIAFASYRRQLRKWNARIQVPWRKRRKPTRKRTSSYFDRNMLVSDDEAYSVPTRRPPSLRRVHPSQEQHVVLCTSGNVTATLTLSEKPRATSNVATNPAHRRVTLAPATNQGGAAMSPVCRTWRSPQDTVPSSREKFVESGNAVMASNSAASEDEQGIPRSFQTRSLVDEASQLNNSAVTNNAVGRSMTSLPGFSNSKLFCPQPSEPQAGGQPSPSAKHISKSSDAHSRKVIHHAENETSSPVKGSPRKKQLKSKAGLIRQPKRLFSSSLVLPHKKMFQRKITSRCRIRRSGLPWNVSPPLVTDSVTGQEASEMTSMHYDEASQGQCLIDEVKCLPDCFPHTEGGGQQQGVIFPNQDQPCPPVNASQSRHTSTEDQPGCSNEPLEQYLTDSKHGLVPTSLAMAVGPAMDTSSPPGGNSGQAVTMRNTSGVYWSCLSDEHPDVGLVDAENFAMNAGSCIAVATDMDFLTAENMTCNGVNIGNQKIRLAHGYDVYVSRFDLWHAEKASSKKGWTILTRRLLDIFFDRMTLAMGKPTHHGNSMEYIPLDQNVIGAIIAFIKARYNIDEKRKLIQAISIYCSDCRKSGVPGWASGEDSSHESKVNDQRSHQGSFVSRQKKRHLNLSATRCAASHSQFPQKGMTRAKIAHRNKRKLARKGANSHHKRNGDFDEASLRRCKHCVAVPTEVDRRGLQLHVQGQHVTLRTSDSMSLTWSQFTDLTESPRAASEVTTTPAHRQGTLADDNPPGLAVVNQVPRRTSVEPSPKEDNQMESSDVVIVECLTPGDGQGISCSPQQGTRPKKDNPQSSLSDKAHSEAQTGTSLSSLSGKNVVCHLPTQPQTSQTTHLSSATVQAVHSEPSSSSPTKTIGYQLGPSMIPRVKSSLKRRPLKLNTKSTNSRTTVLRQLERLFGSVASSQRKFNQRRVPTKSSDQMRQSNVQWNVSPPSVLASADRVQFNPVISDVVGGHQAAELARSQFDGASSQNEMQRLPDGPQTGGGRQQECTDTIQEQRHSPATKSQPHQPLSKEDRPGCSSTPQDHKNSPVPTSVGMTVVIDSSAPPEAPEATADPAAMMQHMGGVYWSCMSDEPTDVALAKPENSEMDTSNDNIPVASQMNSLTVDDMTCNGVNLANQKIRLAQGYDVFITRYDLWDTEKASKYSWSIFTRRLLDLFFDRMTLAMGRASHHGTNIDHKPLDQNVIGAIRAFIKARYNIDKRKLMQAVGFYCSDSRNRMMRDLQQYEDEMEEDDDDEEEDEEEEPSLQELARTDLEEDDDDEDDDWKPKDGKTKRKKKQKEKKEFKRRHVEESELEPRKAKKRAMLDEDEIEDDDDDDDDDEEEGEEEFSLQRLASADLEEDDEDEDDCKPNYVKTKQKKKQKEKNDLKRRHVEEPVLEPRKAKKLATLELSKAEENDSDSDYDDNKDEDYNVDNGALKDGEPVLEPRKAKKLATLELSKAEEDSDYDDNKDEDYNVDNGALKDGDKDMESDSEDDLFEWEDDDDDEDDVDNDDEDDDNDEEYNEMDSDYEERPNKDVKVYPRSLRSKQADDDKKETPRILRTREAQPNQISPANSPDKKARAENKENINGQQRRLRDQPTSKMQNKTTEGSKTPDGKTPGAKTRGAKSPGAKTPDGKTPGAKTPGAKTPGAKTPGAKTPDGKTAGAKIARAKTPGAKTPGAKTPGAITPGAKTPGAKTPGAKTPGAKTPGAKTPGAKTPGAKTPGAKTPGAKTPGAKTPGAKTPGAKTPGAKTPGAKTPGAKTPGAKTPGAKTPGAKSVSLTNQTPKSLKKEKGMRQQPVKTPKKVKLPGGTVIEELVTGDGNVAKGGKMVYVYYRGTLAGSGKVFDSCLGGKPFNFRLGRSEVISGWDVGIAGMKVGGKRRITVPASQGYGRKKVGPIPSNSTLIFNVELKNVS